MKQLFLLKQITLGFLLVLGFSGSTQAAEISKLNVGNLKEVTVEKDGKTASYTLDSQIKEMYLSGGSLRMGQTTKCDPYLGSTTKEIVIATEVVEKDQKALATPEKVIIHIPADTSVYGRCQSNSNTLIALSIHRPNDSKLRVRSSDDIPSKEEIAETKDLKLKQDKIEETFAAANAALANKDYLSVRKNTATLAHQRLNSKQEKALKELIAATPHDEQSVGAFMHYPPYVTELDKAFNTNLDSMNIAQFILVIKNFASGKSKTSAVSIGASGVIHQVVGDLGDELTSGEAMALVSPLSELLKQTQNKILAAVQAQASGQKISYDDLKNQGATGLDLQWYLESLADLSGTSEGAAAFTQIALEMNSFIKANPAFVKEFRDYEFNSALERAGRTMIRKKTLNEEFKALMISRGFQFRG